jgi:hypothetical protein
MIHYGQLNGNLFSRVIDVTVIFIRNNKTQWAVHKYCVNATFYIQKKTIFINQLSKVLFDSQEVTYIRT